MAEIKNSGHLTTIIYKKDEWEKKGKKATPVKVIKEHNEVLLQMLKEERDYIAFVQSTRPVTHIIVYYNTTVLGYAATEYTTQETGPINWKTLWEATFPNEGESTITITKVELINHNMASDVDTAYCSYTYTSPLEVLPDEIVTFQWTHTWTRNPGTEGGIGGDVFTFLQQSFESGYGITTPFRLLIVKAFYEGGTYEKTAEVTEATPDESATSAWATFRWGVKNEDSQDHTINEVIACHKIPYGGFFWEKEALSYSWPKGSTETCELKITFAT